MIRDLYLQALDRTQLLGKVHARVGRVPRGPRPSIQGGSSCGRRPLPMLSIYSCHGNFRISPSIRRLRDFSSS
jgi:hypothetical protein